MLITSLVPLLISFFLVLNITRTYFKDQQISNMLDESQLACRNLTGRIEQLSQVTQNLTDYITNQFLNRQPTSSPQSYLELTRYENMRNNISSIETLYDIGRIRIYSDWVPFLSNSNHLNFFDADALEEITAEYPELLGKMSLKRLNYLIMENNVSYLFTHITSNTDIISFYRCIYNVDSDLIALFIMDCASDSFLDCAATLNEGNIVIANEAGRIICSNISGEDEAYLAGLHINASEGYLLRDKRLIVQYVIPSIDWTMTLSLPFESNVNVWKVLRPTYICIIICTFLLSVGLSVFISRQQARRLQNYYNAVCSIDYSESRNELPDRLDHMLAEVRNPDEVDQLMISFTTLIRDNLRLINDMKQHDLEIEKYKFKVLQEQINPHFLYNALETLRLCMMMDRRQDALKSLDSLSRFYRIALSKGRDTISVREEIDMIQNYLEIENIGYGGSILWSFDIDECCFDLPIPKFLLQPLVENSILHSKLPEGEDRLRIGISVQEHKGILEMNICDNGLGIEPKTLRYIQDSLAADTMQRGKNGFGLKNVNRRLKLFYGSEYGLEIQSAFGRTENIIRLPIDVLW